MSACGAFVDANSCVASFGKPLNPSNLHHFATPTIGQFGTAGYQQALERGHEPTVFCVKPTDNVPPLSWFRIEPDALYR
jgi:hypothetical protein